jgi:glycosyltransferase involved in cell wall biosynthesis
MKIVYVSDTIYPFMHGGKEKRLFELSTRLAAQGHDVHIYTMHWWDEPDTVVMRDGVQLHALCKKYELYTGDRRTIKEGVMFGLACLKLIGVPFDVIDVDHMPFFPILSAWVACLSRHKKFYGTWHEALTRQEWIDYMGIGGNIAALIERICIRLPHTVIAASRHTMEGIQTTLKREKNVYLVASGIDYEAVQAIKPSSKHYDVMTVCRLVKDKNIDMLIKAIGVVAKKNPKVSLLILGNGPEKKRLVELTRRLKLTRNVHFVERMEAASDVYAHMKSAKVFCLPTRREGFSIVTLEALSCNTPVITLDSPTNASRFLVQDGKNGSLVKLDELVIAEALTSWLLTIKSKQLSRGVAKYSWDKLAKAQERIYAA